MEPPGHGSHRIVGRSGGYKKRFLLERMPEKFNLKKALPTLTMTFALKTYLLKKTQNTSYSNNPDNNRVDTLRLGSLTKAMKATQRPMPMASIKSQWPVMIQINTIVRDTPKEKNSATVNRPQPPREILFFFPQGLQWKNHMVTEQWTIT